MSSSASSLPASRLFHGVFVPPATAYTETGAVNLAIVEPYAQMLIDDDVAGVFVTGTLGESASLTVAERQQLARAWTSAIKKRNPNKKVIVHIGTQNIPESQELAADAAAAGADAIASMPPVFFKPKDVATLVTWLAAIASAAPNTPFLYYHFPNHCGLPFRCEPIMREALARIPTFRGVKFTSYDGSDLISCVTHFPTLDIISGFDDAIPASLRLSIETFISGISNAFYPIFRAALRTASDPTKADAATAQNPLGREVNPLMQRFIEAMNQMDAIGFGPTTNIIGSVRYYVGQRLKVEMGPSRPPLHGVTKAQDKQTLDQIYTQVSSNL